MSSFIHSLCIYFRYSMLSEGSLQIHGAQVKDAGHYVCTVSNQAGSDHRRMDLRVFGKYNGIFSVYKLQGHFCFPICPYLYFIQKLLRVTVIIISVDIKLFCLFLVGPSISPGPFNITVTTGIRAVLSCETTGIPTPKVSWKRNGTPLDINQLPGEYR